MSTFDPHWRPNTDASLTSLFIDSVVDYAMFVLDTHGAVRSWNPGAQRLKGYDAGEIIGRDFSVFYTEPDRESGLPATLLERARVDGRVTHRGWRVRKDGSRFFGEVTITALRDDDGVLRGFAKVTRDRTDQREAEQAMARALDRERRAALELVRLQEVRSQFMAAVSHDLQTPIGAIRGALSLLDESDEDQAELIAILERNLTRLASMIRQLSEASRLERGRTQITPEPTDLPTAVDACLLALQPLLEGREVQVAVDGEAEVDPDALERVLANLLTNAHRHSPDGRPVVVRSHRADGQVVLEVEDEGPGVPPEDRERIFEEFLQGADRTSTDGLGLGLSIVRHYARAHGGDAWVENGRHGGARFQVSLPDHDRD